jgi:hypothetical protein
VTKFSIDKTMEFSIKHEENVISPTNMCY